MTIATTGVSVQQMRGGTLRLDPADPQKLASNWYVVCVAPDMVRGTADYERSVRKLCICSRPPRTARSRRALRTCTRRWGRSAAPGGALRRVERRAAGASVRPGRRPRAVAGRDAVPRRSSCPPGRCGRRGRTSRRPPSAAPHAACSSLTRSRSPVASGAPRCFAVLGLTPARRSSSPARARPARPGWPRPPGAAKKRLPLVSPLDAAAAPSPRPTGSWASSRPRPRAATIEPRAAGYPRVEPTKATPTEESRFAAALDELVGVSDVPRYLVSRPLADPRRGRPSACSGGC